MMTIASMVRRRCRVLLLALAAIPLLAACGGGGDDAGDAEPDPSLPAAPAFTQHPASTSVDDGGTATFTASASGTGAISYQWQRNGGAIAGATTGTLTLPASYADNGALISVVAGNAGGRTTSKTATLTVRPLAPTITAQPQAASVAAGETAQFTVAVSGGTPPVTYQWQRDGADIDSATAASYTTPALSADDDGARYRVVVGNPAGKLNSEAALLTVQAAPKGYGQITLSGPGAASVRAGDTFAPTDSLGSIASGPICNGVTCSSSLKLFWHVPGEQLSVQLLSLNAQPPGAAPGSQVDMIAISLGGGFGYYGINFTCSAGQAGCTPDALGLTLDTAARTLRFANTTLPIFTGGPLVTINGTLKY